MVEFTEAAKTYLMSVPVLLVSAPVRLYFPISHTIMCYALFNSEFTSFLAPALASESGFFCKGQTTTEERQHGKVTLPFDPGFSGNADPDLLKKFADMVLDFAEEFVLGTASTVDDAIILPICELIRKTFNIPDEDEPIPDEDEPSDKVG